MDPFNEVLIHDEKIIDSSSSPVKLKTKSFLDQQIH